MRDIDKQMLSFYLITCFPVLDGIILVNVVDPPENNLLSTENQPGKPAPLLYPHLRGGKMRQYLFCC